MGEGEERGVRSKGGGGGKEKRVTPFLSHHITAWKRQSIMLVNYCNSISKLLHTTVTGALLPIHALAM